MSHDGRMPDARVRRTPEEEHLADQERLLEELTEQLATKEADFATSGVEFARFRSSYLTRFAPLYAELDRLEAEVARLLADRFKYGSDEAREAQAHADEADARASESASAAASAEDEPEPKPEAAPGLKALYREVAKAVHPDLAGDDAERIRRTRVMAAVSQAYAEGDEPALRRILDAEAARPDAVMGDDVGARLVRVLRKIAQVRGRFTELVELHAGLEGDPMWELFDTVRVARKGGADPIADTEAGLHRQIRSATAQLEALHAEGRV
jgi:hypothetical protein